MFTGLDDVTFVVPSQWIAGLLQSSFLKAYPTHVIPNGIDLSIFKETESDFRQKYGLENKKIILGVASVWSKQKGLGEFIKLSQRLDASYQIVVVGVSEEQKRSLPSNVLAFTRTDSVQELAQIYASADVFFNPSVQETMGLTTVEAMACGTPVIVYNKTAVPEVVDEESGVVLPCSIENFEEAFEKAKDKKCGAIARAQDFEKGAQFRKYIALYESKRGGGQS